MPRVGDPRNRRRHFIREWRHHRGLTQQQLADRLDTTKANISRVETLKQGYTHDFLEACADVLNTTPGSLIMRDPSDEEGIWAIWESAKPDLAESLAMKQTAVTPLWKRKRRPHFIRAWREHRGLTQEQLADLIGTSAHNVYRVEALKEAYTQNFLEACAEALMADPCSLIGRNPPGTFNHPTAH